MLVDHVHQIGRWPERGWLVEIVHGERHRRRAAELLLTLAKMHAGLPLQAVGLIGEVNIGDITAMLDRVPYQSPARTAHQLRPHLDDQLMTTPRPAHFLSTLPAPTACARLPAPGRWMLPLKIFHLGYLLPAASRSPR